MMTRPLTRGSLGGWAVCAALLVFNALGGCATTVPSCEDDPEQCRTYHVESQIHQEDLEMAYDIVFVPDGYTQEDMPQFHKDVEAFIASMSETTPLLTARVPDLFNFHAISAPSQTRNTTNDFRDDTLLGGHRSHHPEFANVKMIGIIEDYATKIAALAPDVDVVVAVVRDSPWRANARPPHGGEPALVVISSQDAKPNNGVLVHELGHALFNLDDEYVDVDDCVRPFFIPDEASLVEAPNVSLDPTGHKWSHLLPAPGGAIEGGAGYSQCIYRPTPHCKMRDSNDPFCAVCAAEIEATLSARRCKHERLPPRVAIASPRPGQPHLRDLVLNVAAFDHTSLSWMRVTLNHREIGNGPYQEAQVMALPDVKDGSHRLCVEVSDAFGQTGHDCIDIVTAADPIDHPVARSPPDDWPEITLRTYGYGSDTMRFIIPEGAVIPVPLIRVEVRGLPSEFVLHEIRVEGRAGRRLDEDSTVFRVSLEDVEVALHAEALIEDAQGRRARIRVELPPVRRVFDPTVVEVAAPIEESRRVTGTIPIPVIARSFNTLPPQSIELFVKGERLITYTPPVSAALSDQHQAVLMWDTRRHAPGPTTLRLHVVDGWGHTHDVEWQMVVDHGASWRPDIVPMERFGRDDELRVAVPGGKRVDAMTLWTPWGSLDEKIGGPYRWTYPLTLDEPVGDRSLSSPVRALGQGGRMEWLAVARVDDLLIGGEPMRVDVAAPNATPSRDDLRAERAVCELAPTPWPIGCQGSIAAVSAPRSGSPAGPLSGVGLLLMSLAMVVRHQRRTARGCRGDATCLSTRRRS